MSRTAAPCSILMTSAVLAAFLSAAMPIASGQEIPEALQPWTGWVLSGDTGEQGTPLHDDPGERIGFWPSRLTVDAKADGGDFEFSVSVQIESWVPLPGTASQWPIDVRRGEEALVVVDRDGTPAVRLPPGSHSLTGAFRWDSMPQRLALPPTIGLIDLTVSDQRVDHPRWDATGQVWLRRGGEEADEKDSLSVQVYRVLEDGIPVWLRTEVELTVTGRSREEPLGSALPVGWQLSTVQSPIPVALDDSGQLKAQVRAGKWTVTLHAFRTDNPSEIRFAEGATPIVSSELFGLRADPSLRVVQLDGAPMIDVTQTTFPSKWRSLPVYLWQTDSVLKIDQKIRGMGDRSRPGLEIERQFWLDEDGGGLTYQDDLEGKSQQTWRLDAAKSQTVGAVQIDGDGQLITTNPTTGDAGVEIRDRTFKMQAVGRIEDLQRLPATGWQTDAGSLRWTLTLPPGWRVLAMLGPDEVRGDWLTAWSLLDLFLLLVFSLGVYRLFGPMAGGLALLAFGAAYHEPMSPRWTWLAMLIPIALLKVVPPGRAASWIKLWKGLTAALLLICLVPFLARQAQNILYPQLESPGHVYGQSDILRVSSGRTASVSMAGMDAEMQTETADYSRGSFDLSAGAILSSSTPRAGRYDSTNLLYDPKAKIQTGPAKPQWQWNQVTATWDGPVSSDQTVRPILVYGTMHRIIAAVRLALLITLSVILIRMRLPKRMRQRTQPAVATVAAILIVTMAGGQANAQFPGPELLQELEDRLTPPDAVFNHAAEIPSVELTIDGNQVEMSLELHAAEQVAVPLPGRLLSWSPVSVTIDGEPADSLIRRDGYLFIEATPGVHKVQLKGLLPEVTEWDLTYLLAPHYLSINAPGWKSTGVSPDGVPGEQVLLVREQNLSADQAAYDRNHFNAIFLVDRQIEIGIVTKVVTTIKRLSMPGKAASLRIPLLPGERVLSPGRNVTAAGIAVSLAATQSSVQWQSELPSGSAISLSAPSTDRWVEQWTVVTSPVWNLSYEGLAPVYQDDTESLMPVWHPWPGEQVTLTLTKPVAVVGETVTIQRATRTTTLGRRIRTNKLDLSVQTSLATDLVIDLIDEVEISGLKRSGTSIPVRRDGSRLIVPTDPGEQSIEIQWQSDQDLSMMTRPRPVMLPAAAANVAQTVVVPRDRWVLWASGPLRGPAVRFWVILIVALFVAVALGSVPHSPLSRWQWTLLLIGLTQVPWPLATTVVAWLFALAYRGRPLPEISRLKFNAMQVAIIGLTVIALMVLIGAIARGLLGSPDMFILGNGSTRTSLRWFDPHGGDQWPTVQVISVSVWFYRLAMLAWALWLASSLLKWLTWGWEQFSREQIWRSGPNKKSAGGDTPTVSVDPPPVT